MSNKQEFKVEGFQYPYWSDYHHSEKSTPVVIYNLVAAELKDFYQDSKMTIFTYEVKQESLWSRILRFVGLKKETENV